jgi:hypothetical protein
MDNLCQQPMTPLDDIKECDVPERQDNRHNRWLMESLAATL